MRTISYNDEAYLKKIIEKSLSVLPSDSSSSSLKYDATPLLELPDRYDISNASNPTGVSHGCPWCHGLFDDSEFLQEGQKRKKTRAGQTAVSSDPASRLALCGALAASREHGECPYTYLVRGTLRKN